MLGQQEGTPEERLQAVAEQLGIPIRHVEIAADYWATHRAEIDERVAANIEAADRELAAWKARQALLGA